MTNQIPNNKYTFLPWIKTGLGSLISNNEQDLQGMRAKVSVDMKVRRFDQYNNPDDQVITKDFLLYGPGDVIGLLKNTVIRTEPRDNEINVEPNFFVHVEFSQPDFPWRYTPARPQGTQQGLLSPWLSLIVLTDEEFEKVATNSGLLPAISINKPEKSLPDLEQSWSWAHTQISQEITGLQALIEILNSKPHLAISRLLCLRKLEPDRLYHAFLVPSFEAGRLAGLGEEPKGDLIGTAFAWKVTGDNISSDGHNLPVYYQWQFTTSKETGDFESMIKKLEAHTLSENIGLRELDISKPFLSIGSDLGIEKPVFFGGVLWSPLAKKMASEKRIDVHNPSPEEVKNLIEEMKKLLDLPEKLSWSYLSTSSSSSNADPIISPPMYGKWHAQKRLVSLISDNYQDPKWIKDLVNDTTLTTEERTLLLQQLDELKKNDAPPYPWLEELNLDPTNRAAAGLGALIVQELQEELMASAWDQAGSLSEANKRLRLSQLARTISISIFERSFQVMDPSVLIRFVTPLHPRVIVKENNRSVSGLIYDSPIPKAIFSPSFNKITARRNKIHRNLFDKDTHISSELLEHFNKNPSNPDPNPDTPDQSKPEERIFTIDALVRLLQEIGPISPDLEKMSHGPKLEQYLANNQIEQEIRDMVKMVEMSIPDTDSKIEEHEGVVIPLDIIHEKLTLGLNPAITINLKSSMEIERPERLDEEKKDILDPIVVYPKFKRPMFEPLRDLSEDLLLPGVKDIPDNTISILETNSTFINSYMVGLNHEMARELVWREYPTDQRGSYFRQFWDASIAVQRERMTSPSSHPNIEEIVEKYRDIPEIHRWKNSALDEIGGIPQGERTVLLIKGEVLRRHPGMVIYASKAILDPTGDNEPTLPSGNNNGAVEEITEPIFRGTIQPDITFFGFEMSIEKLRGNNTPEDPGYFFVLQEQPSEPRFGIDEGSLLSSDPRLDPSSLDSWDNLTWDYVTLSSTSNSYIDLENGPLIGKEIENVKWGSSHAADLANILLQKPVRIAVHAKDMLDGIS
jgi:hypothetical protein